MPLILPGSENLFINGLDPTGNDDCGPVFNSAFANGGADWIPPGWFITNEPIVAPNPEFVRGCGAWRSDAAVPTKALAASGATFIVAGPNFPSGQQIVTLEGSGSQAFDFTIVDPSAVAAGTFCLASGTKDVRAENIAVYGSPFLTPTDNSCGGYRLLDPYANCLGQSTALGFNISGPDLKIHGGWTKSCAFEINGGADADLEIMGFHFTGGNGSYQVKVQPNSSNTARLTNCQFDSGTGTDGTIWLAGNGYLVVDGGLFYANGGGSGNPMLFKGGSGGHYGLNGVEIRNPSGSWTVVSDTASTEDYITSVRAASGCFTSATSGTLATFFGSGTPGRVIAFDYGGTWQPEVT